tara:strand:+ start:10821 stop:11177 length:357 start_codon:yes stop_codon:yes gene_type:complete
MHKKFKKILLVGTITVFSTAVIFASTNLKEVKSCKTVVKIDVDKIINDFVRKVNVKPMSKKEMDTVVGMFTIRLVGEIEDVADKNNYTVLPKRAVITGAEDITSTVNSNLMKEFGDIK